ncbi:MAG: PqqD family protein [Desulfobacterales bacterium]|nr:PqqD family protein [Desulfobacterales bacterium]
MNMKTNPKRKSDLVWREVGGEIAIISPDNKHLHTLNDVGSRIWQLLDGENDLSAIADIISAEYEEEEEVVELDLAEYVENLRRLKLLEG